METPKISYGQLISHTFPGLLLAIEIILFFKLFTPYDGFNFLYTIDYKVTNFIGILIVFYVLSTILGVVLDGITILYSGIKKIIRICIRYINWFAIMSSY
jgi:hypothetical protein